MRRSGIADGMRVEWMVIIWRVYTVTQYSNTKKRKSKINNIIFRRRRTRMIQISLEAEPQPEEYARDDSANLEIDRDSMKVEWE